jgi:trans-2,3-dihydro-3-hydroxyanthranilate isomerase
MQKIAREFNYSETTFVFPPKTSHTRHVRIFTPASELPFAGHPNVGTAFVLAVAGELGEIRSSLTVTFEEKAGPVPVSIREADGKILSCELAAPQALSLGKILSAKLLSSGVSLTPEDIQVKTHPPQVVSVGLPFIMVELKDLSALERARPNISNLEAILAEDVQPMVYMYVHTAGVEIRARMFAPLSGVVEDPATGSAACALGAMLAHHQPQSSGAFQWRITQGVEMGRTSILTARAEKSDGIVQRSWVGGPSVLVSEGFLHVE